MSREEMHAVLDAVIDYNERHTPIEISADFGVKVFSTDMHVALSVWDRVKLSSHSGGYMIKYKITDSAAEALALIEKYGGIA